MKFELLPNEIFIECFEYLNAYEIFYSFDRLNSRFSQLIQTIFFSLNFQSVSKKQFDKFCSLMQLNLNIKTQIYSLILSNKETSGQIDLFLSLFSLDDFPQLRSLIFIQLEKNNIEIIKTMLPLMNQLQTFRIFELHNSDDDFLSLLPLSNLRRVTIPTIKSFHQTSNLTHLTISGCSLDQLICQLFRFTPLLKYLHVESIYKTSHPIKTTEHYPAKYLTRLVIDSFEYPFEEFECLIRLTVNLKCLIITAIDNVCMIDAQQWECLIRSCLMNLKIFQFIFGLYCRGNLREDVIKQFKFFQSHFWSDEHQWFTEYVLDRSSAVIYTVPYPTNTYRLTLATERYSNLRGNRLSIFDHVTDLTVCSESINEKCVDYFANVMTLDLETLSLRSDSHLLTKEYIESLKRIVNFYHLKHLDLSSYSSIETNALIEIFQLSRNFSSLIINPLILSTLFHNEQLCDYFNNRITKLNIYKSDQKSFNHVDEVKRLCEIFSNIEQLICTLDQSDQLEVLLNNSKSLLSITLHLAPSEQSREFLSWFTREASNFNLIYRIQYFRIYASEIGEWYRTELYIWTTGSNLQF